MWMGLVGTVHSCDFCSSFSSLGSFWHVFAWLVDCSHCVKTDAGVYNSQGLVLCFYRWDSVYPWERVRAWGKNSRLSAKASVHLGIGQSAWPQFTPPKTWEITNDPRWHHHYASWRQMEVNSLLLEYPIEDRLLTDLVLHDVVWCCWLLFHAAGASCWVSDLRDAASLPRWISFDFFKRASDPDSTRCDDQSSSPLEDPAKPGVSIARSTHVDLQPSVLVIPHVRLKVVSRSEPRDKVPTWS